MSEQVNKIKELQKSQKLAFENLAQSFDEKTIENGRDYFAQIREQTTVPFGLYYTLHNTITSCDLAIKENPSRELSIVKTKLQEALFWLNEAE